MVVSKDILKFGYKTPEEWNAEIDALHDELSGFISEMEEKGMDAEREKASLWFAEQYQSFANWDEQNWALNEKMFATITYHPNGKTSGDLASDLPEFERSEICLMLEDSIADAKAVLDGSLVRKDTNMFDWTNVEHIEGNFVSEGRPVFIHDYFSKPLDITNDNTDMFNAYLGALDKPVAISANLITDKEGTVNQTLVDNITKRPADNVGYMMLWHSDLPKFITEDTEINSGLWDGKSNFTAYDINNPVVRDLWEKSLAAIIPQVAGEKYTTLGYCISNEPHWFLDQSHWGVIKNADGTLGFSDYAHEEFVKWLTEKYGDVKAMNENWATEFASFSEATRGVVPLDATKYRGTAVWYDVCTFNMDRAYEWLSFLNDTLVKYDPDGKTHLKIMPDLFIQENRTHGVNLEDLTAMTGIIGNDAKTRKVNFKTTGDSDAWTENFAYMWDEIGFAYDFMASVSPDKAHVNSEGHFLSTAAYRDLYMTPEYVRSTFWFATIMGMDASMNWFWGRNPDGSIENRLQVTDNPGLLQSYPASTAQQPRVANELSATMMDLNAYSEEIVQFQERKESSE